MDILPIASFIGTLAFAFSGYLIGAYKKLDWMGIFILAMLTANGGGAIRDVLVNQSPKILTDITGFYIVLVMFVTALMLKLHRYADAQKSTLFVISDALGLVAFSITGALVAIDAGFHVFGVMVLAFITAAGGGIIRDLLVNDIPTILTSDFYGSIAILTGLAIYGLHYYQLANSFSLTCVFLAAVTTRLCAYFFKWKLPHLNHER